MTTRVRYSNINGTLIASELVSTTLGDTLTVTLDATQLEASITKSDGSLLQKVMGPSLATLKKQVKVILTSHGVVFLNEVRNKQSNESFKVAI